MIELKKRLDKEVEFRDSEFELNYDKPDPLLVAKRYQDEYIALICALFAYGNAKQIVKFLDSLDFSLLTKSDDEITKSLQNSYYRFQNHKDVAEFFIMIKRLKELGSLEDIFYKGYHKQNSVLDGLAIMIETFYSLNPYKSHGYNFLIGTPPTTKSKSTYKRYNMFFRWMVRKDKLDMGLWQKINKKDLLIPLDTHTFKVSQKLGLLKRKTYDLKAVIELTNTLKTLDATDPIKYDFALYRIGQEKL